MVPDRTVREYEALLGGLPWTTILTGVEIQDLFTLDDVAADFRIFEHAGNRISGRRVESIRWSMDCPGLCQNVLVDVPSDRAVIDPPDIGNNAEKLNHRY